MDWGLGQDVMKAKASASDDLARTVHLKAELGNSKAAQITPLMVDNFRIKMKKTVSERTDKPYSGATINKMVSLARRVYYLGSATASNSKMGPRILTIFTIRAAPAAITGTTWC